MGTQSSFSDASATGGGAFIDFNNDFVCHKVWTANESLQSSTWRELSVIEFSLQYFATLLEGSHVKWYTDSQATAKVVEAGSMKFVLHRAAQSIFSICIQSGIHLEGQWIPSSLNQQTDYISCLIDIDDWQITNAFFLFLDGHWGPHTVDCFTNFYNHKLPKFFSRFWNHSTARVDFFFQALRRENCLVVPTVGIVACVLHYMKPQDASGTLVVPVLPSAHYWPLIKHKYCDYLIAHAIRAGNEVLTHGRNYNSLLGSHQML